MADALRKGLLKMGFPEVRVSRSGGAVGLHVNGRRQAPLIMAFARTHYMARGKPDFDYANDVVYDQMRRVYDAGIRLFQPCMPEIGWGPDGAFDYGHFDTVMRRLVEVLPEAYFILRVIVPPPPLPADEQIQVSRRPGDTSDAKACQVFDQISLFSETYRDYAPGAMDKVMAHLAALPEAGRIIGTVICGAGFEWNWGNPGGNWGLMMDICPAVTRAFGRFLEAKYRTVSALRAAWGDDAADFEHPRLPGIEERSRSDVAGFRDPSQPRSRWIQDFLDCYNDQPTRVLTGIFERVAADATAHVDATPSSRERERESGEGAASTVDATSSREREKESGGGAASTPLFHGVFHVSVMNTAFSGVQTMPGVFGPILEQPALGFVTNCLTYGDRKAGGVSVYMHAGYHSLTLHDKLAIGEADIRPGTAGDTWNEASIADGVASMRREFAAMLLAQRQGLWYFDMPGGWFDHPDLLAELGRQAEVGQRYLDVPHTNVAETLVVYENRSWKYFGLAEKPLALHTVWSGENQQILSDMTQANMEWLQRLGAPHDGIVAEDFVPPRWPELPAPGREPEQDAPATFYKLLIFPFSFLCEPATRAEVHRRVEAGATALFLFAAGITDGETASPANMEALLGMRVRVDAPGPLVASFDEAIAREHGIDGADRRLGNPGSQWHRFVVDDPHATPLAHYADGAVAAAMVERGKGRMLFAGVSAASPALYRMAARIAGVHLYSDQGDALYASGEFLVLHTRDAAGPRTLRLPGLAREVTEIFSGEVVARHAAEFTVDLPAKRTVVYRTVTDMQTA